MNNALPGRPGARAVQLSRRAGVAGTAIFLLLAAGCRTAQEDRVMGSVNAYHYYNARYDERCVPTGPVGCAATNAALKAWRKGLDEAKAALVRGGAIPLQVAHVDRLQKETKKCLPK